MGGSILKARKLSLISGFEARRGGEVVTHLQFTHVTILFTLIRWEEITTLKRILRCFQLALGLKIKLSNNFLVGVGCTKDNIQILADRLHCKLGLS